MARLRQAHEKSPWAGIEVDAHRRAFKVAVINSNEVIRRKLALARFRISVHLAR